MSSYTPPTLSVPNFSDPLPGEEPTTTIVSSSSSLNNQSNNNNNNQQHVDITNNNNNLNNNYKNLFNDCGHPLICFFHFFFKITAIFCYLFLALFTNNFVLVFVIVVLLSSFDFYMVKNISGRYLVALRWWNDIQQDGTSIWRFENKSNIKQVNKIDKYIFWGTMYIQPIIWVLLSLLFIFHLQWLIVNIFVLILSCFNLYGYIKCSNIDTSKQIKDFIVEKGLLQVILSKLFQTNNSSSILPTTNNN
ncbi:hypothetical protein ABK040_013637 [Willaertia magna]